MKTKAKKVEERRIKLLGQWRVAVDRLFVGNKFPGPIKDMKRSKRKAIHAKINQAQAEYEGFVK